MSGSFINDKQNVSWILNQYRPENDHTVPYQSTVFASSSLAAVASAIAAQDFGSQIYSLERKTHGVSKANIDIYSTDKSVLGVEYQKRLHGRGSQFDSRVLKTTTPNIFSLKSKYTLL